MDPPSSHRVAAPIALDYRPGPLTDVKILFHYAEVNRCIRLIITGGELAIQVER
jgi:hypothetical protein